MSDPSLRHVADELGVGSACTIAEAAADTPPRFSEQLRGCAAYLRISGAVERLEDQLVVGAPERSGSSRDEWIDAQVKDSIRRLKRVGLLPSGLGWLFAFALRRAAWAFLEQLLRWWLFESPAIEERHGRRQGRRGSFS